MARLELNGGFYLARSLIANAQRCVNLYPEKNPEDAPTKFTHYLTPGLRLRSAGRLGASIRGAYLSTANQLFVVEGSQLYYVDPTWARFAIGLVTVGVDTPISMQDNGTTMVVVDGQAGAGWTVNLATFAFAPIVDAAFYGADRVDYVDTFLVYNRPGTRQWYCGPSNGVTPFDPLDIASKTGYPDKLATLIVVHREVWLLGTQKSSEVWYNAGGADFPFAITAGVFLQQGCIAKYSVARNDLLVFWLGVDEAGERTVFMGAGYAAKRISTPAVAVALAKYAVVSDAIGMVYKQSDHVFYILTFPTEDVTWVFDVSEGLWHERDWVDTNGAVHRHRANCCLNAYGKVVVGDWENGNLYTFELDQYTDEVGEVASPIVRRRGFPHVMNDGLRAECTRFAADMQVGESEVTGLDAAGEVDANLIPRVMLRASTNGGRTFRDPVELELGVQGNFEEQPYVRGLGLGRKWVFELFWSLPANTTLNGAWADFIPAKT